MTHKGHFNSKDRKERKEGKERKVKGEGKKRETKRKSKSRRGYKFVPSLSKGIFIQWLETDYCM
jgi:hypothetical protein